MQLKEETVLEVLVKFGMAPDAAQKIVLEAKTQDKNNKVPPTKSTPKEFMIVVNDPHSKLPADLTGWIIQKELMTDVEGESLVRREWGDLEVEYAITKYAKMALNDGEVLPYKEPIRNLGDLIEFGKKSEAKHHGLIFKTKTPIAIVGVDLRHCPWQVSLDEKLDIKHTPKA